jgi:hypothetical protein
LFASDAAASAGSEAISPAAAVSNLGNGTYMVNFVPKFAGRHLVTVLLGPPAGQSGETMPAGGSVSDDAFQAAAGPFAIQGTGRPDSFSSPYSILVKSGAPDVSASQLISALASRWIPGWGSNGPLGGIPLLMVKCLL